MVPPTYCLTVVEERFLRSEIVNVVYHIQRDRYTKKNDKKQRYARSNIGLLKHQG